MSVIKVNIVDENDDASHEFQDEFLPVVVRSEINFLQFPFFALSWRGLKNKTKTEYRLVEPFDTPLTPRSLGLLIPVDNCKTRRYNFGRPIKKNEVNHNAHDC